MDENQTRRNLIWTVEIENITFFVTSLANSVGISTSCAFGVKVSLFKPERCVVAVGPEAHGAHNRRHCLARFQLSASTHVANGPDAHRQPRRYARWPARPVPVLMATSTQSTLLRPARPPSSAKATPRQRGRPRNPSTSCNLIGPKVSAFGAPQRLARVGEF
jgi:hypothetical protein